MLDKRIKYEIFTLATLITHHPYNILHHMAFDRKDDHRCLGLSSSNSEFNEYMRQYHLTSVPIPSDDSDYEDLSYKTNIIYEKWKIAYDIQEMLIKQTQTENRKRAALLYYNNNVNIQHSIFNQPGMRFLCYDEKTITFMFQPYKISPEYICAHRYYYAKIVYNKDWSLKKLHAPNKDKFIDLFRKIVNDNDLKMVLRSMYDILVDCALEQVKIRKRQHERYLAGEEIYLNSDDERLFLTDDERITYKSKKHEIWSRMILPEGSEYQGIMIT